MADALASLLEEVGHAQSASFDREGDAFRLEYDEVFAVRIVPAEDGRTVRLSTALCPVPSREAEPVLVRALRANMDPADTGAGWLALSPDLPVLQLAERHRLATLDAAQFADALAAFILRARTLRLHLAAPDPEPTDPPMAPWRPSAVPMIRG